MELKDLLQMDMSEAIDWLLQNENDFVLTPKGMKTEEIRPEKAGELWESVFNMKWFTHYMCSDKALGLAVTSEQKVCLNLDELNIIHGKNWTRIFPPVEDDSVERIEIKAVSWHQGSCCYPMTSDIRPNFGNFADFINKPPMKMILEIPKETK